MTTTPHVPSRSTTRSVRRPLTALLVVLSLAASGCFALIDQRNSGVGVEANRVNVVVYKTATKFLYDLGRQKGSGAARQLVLAGTPKRIEISTSQRLAICALSPALCLSADQIGRTIVNWFRSDIRSRADFWEALSAAGSQHRCFAWTFLPSRNLTHKGTGTAGCRTGVLL